MTAAMHEALQTDSPLSGVMTIAGAQISGATLDSAIRPRHVERRHGLRVPLELWMEELHGRGDVYFRRTGNISEGGVFFEKAIPHPVGTIITLKFTLPHHPEMLVARARVVSAAAGTNGLGMGVHFVHFEGDAKARLRSALQEKSHSRS